MADETTDFGADVAFRTARAAINALRRYIPNRGHVIERLLELLDEAEAQLPARPY